MSQRAGPGRATAAAAHRADRLLRWYPRAWRARYGEEFRELLIADVTEQPRSRRRTIDVAINGTRARFRYAGLCGQVLGPADQVRASLAVLGGALAVFLTLGATVWSQLVIGWQWAPPGNRASAVAMVVMSAAMLLFAGLAALAAVPVGWYLARAARRGSAGRLVRPAGLALLGAAVLIIGGRHFGNGWPGTGGHPWPERGLVPGGVAAFGWASTMWVTSYWAHPAAVAAFPAAQIGWMAASPAAVAGLAAGLVTTVRRLDLPPAVLRYEARVGWAAAATMAAFLIGAACWVVGSGSGARGLFRVGAIDVVALLLMTVALAVGGPAARRARAAGPPRGTTPGRP